MRRMPESTLRWSVLWLLAIAAVGCGRSDRGAITGTVTLDGRAVDGGTISFIPVDGNEQRAAWSEITAGRYAIAAKLGAGVGANRVKVSWPRKTGKILPALPPAPSVEEVVEMIPARYNSGSDLKVEIKPGANQIDLELKSK